MLIVPQIGGEAFRNSLIPMVENCRSVRNVCMNLSYYICFCVKIIVDGPTETTIWSSCYLIPRLSPDKLSLPIPVGKPISQTAFYLVSEKSSIDNKTVVCLSGDEGELCIGGIGVAAGYLNSPTLTIEKFIVNPFGSGVIYRTGDHVRRLDGGDYVFVHRLDDQVKVDGFRIELSEIENVYSQHPLVRQAVALVRDNRLGIYILPSEGSILEQTQLSLIREHAKRFLMYYMMPKYDVITPIL